MIPIDLNQSIVSRRDAGRRHDSSGGDSAICGSSQRDRDANAVYVRDKLFVICSLHYSTDYLFSYEPGALAGY